MPSGSSCGIVVLVSGRGSNLQAIIDATRTGALPVDIRAVISNNLSALALQRARTAGIPAEVLDHRGFESRAAFEQALRHRIDVHAPQLVVLAGFMRVLGNDFIDHYRGRLINIHPSLLPAFPGLDTHARALAAGAKYHGASVHFVTPAVDGGPVIAQTAITIAPDDTAEILAKRVLEAEHRLYPRAIRWFAEGRLSIQNDGVLLDGSIKPEQGLIRD